MAYTIDKKSGLYTLAKNSRKVNNQTPVTAAMPVVVTKTPLPAPSVAGETAGAAAERQAKVNSYAQVLKNQAAAGAAAPSVAGENAGRAISKPTAPETQQPVYTPVAAAQPTNVAAPTAQQKVSYIDGNGDKQIGYADVVAPESAPAETEAPAENTVDYWATMKEMYNNLYAEAVKANDAQAAAAAERAAAAADEQLAALAAQYEGTNRQLYRDYMQTQRVLPQQLAAQGYSGGLSESARLKLGISYQDALARNEQARITAAAGIGSERAQTEYEIAAAAAEANRQALANQNAQLIALEQERYSYEQALKEARAQQMATAGDFSGMLDLGYSQDDVDYLTRVWLLENPAMQATWIAAHPEMAARLGLTGGRSSGGSGGGGTYKSTKTAAQLIADNQQERDYAEILEAQAVANDMARAGATKDEIEETMAEGVVSGKISYAAASAAVGTQNKNSGTYAPTTTTKTYNSVKEAGGLWNYLMKNPTKLGPSSVK